MSLIFQRINPSVLERGLLPVEGANMLYARTACIVKAVYWDHYNGSVKFAIDTTFIENRVLCKMYPL